MTVASADSGSEPSIIDYTHTRWGHNLSIEQKPDGLMRGFCWRSHRVQEGDRLVWQTSYGKATGVVTEARGVLSVGDMYEITVRVIEREGTPT